MNKNHSAGFGFLGLLGGALLATVFYNYWAWCGGHCSARTFITPGVPGGVLFLATGLGLGILGVLKWRRRTFLDRFRCSCGAPLLANWIFCPDCGKSCEE
jgi:hypothetical protein